jgi:hypothetical protein
MARLLARTARAGPGGTQYEQQVQDEVGQDSQLDNV